MRLALPAVAVVFALCGCRASTNEEGELTRSQCADLVRHVQALKSSDTGGMRVAMQAAFRPEVEGCLRRGTERAFRCVMQAEAVRDLESCEALYK